MKNIKENNNNTKNDDLIFMPGYPSDLTEQDKLFAHKLANDFDLPHIVMEINISGLRSLVDSELVEGNYYRRMAKEYKGSPDYIKYYQNILDLYNGPGAKFIDISINTNKGTIKIDITSIFFPFFKIGLRKMRLECEKAIKYTHPTSLVSKDMKFLSNIILGQMLYAWNIGKFKKYAIAGYILIYFKLDRYKTLRTEQEFLENPNAQDYKHYLYDNMKSRFEQHKGRIFQYD